DADFEKQTTNLDHADEVRLAAAGPVAASVRVVRSFSHSRIVQEIRVTAGVPRVDIVSDVDWHEKHVLLKAAFAVAQPAGARASAAGSSTGRSPRGWWPRTRAHCQPRMPSCGSSRRT